MIKRPLNSHFSAKVIDGTKFTTIRSKPWPTWKDIMLYNWSGAAYRSKQVDVCAVMVYSEMPILITNVSGAMIYTPDNVDGIPFHKTEGFDSLEEMDAWFSKIVKPSQTVTKHLMRFKKI